MNWSRPLDHVLGSRSKVALLRCLLRTRGEHSGRELARVTGLDPKTCHAALQDLARQGIVQYRRMGTALSYTLNDRHVWVRDGLAPLFQMEDRLPADYARDLRRRLGPRVLSIILFGSVARGDERPGSDLDLLVVAPNSTAPEVYERALDAAAVKLSRSYGTSPHVVWCTREAFQRKARSGNGLMTDVLRTGRVVWGRPLAELLSHGG